MRVVTMASGLITGIGRASDLAEQSLLDPVGKSRVSNPMNLVDTDFEYGRQTTRWQDLELINNIPTFFARDNDESLSVVSVDVYQGSTNVLVTCSQPHDVSIGTPIFVQGVNSYSAEGGFVVSSVASDLAFYYKANSEQIATQDIFDGYSTYIWRAQFYQGTAYSLDTLGSILTDNGFPTSKITVDTVYPHGFTEKSAFVLARSVGTKALTFDAATVDIRETITSNVSYVAENSIGSTSGLLDRAVTPYDWIGTSSLYISLDDIDSATGGINYASHGYADGDLALYVPPVNDAPLTGLSPFTIYQVTNQTDDSFQLGIPTQTPINYYSPYAAYNGNYGNTNLYLWQGSVSNATVVDLSNFPNFYVINAQQRGDLYHYTQLYAKVDGVDVLLDQEPAWQYSYRYFSYWGRHSHTLPNGGGLLTEIRMYMFSPWGCITSGWSGGANSVAITYKDDPIPIQISSAGATASYGSHTFMKAYRVDRAYDNLLYIQHPTTSTFNQIPTYVFSSTGTVQGFIPLIGTTYSDLPTITGFPGFTNQGGLWSSGFAQYNQGRNTLYMRYYFNTGGRGWESDFFVEGDIDMHVSIRPHTSYQIYHGLSIFPNVNYWNPGNTASGRISAVVFNNGSTGYLYLNGETNNSNVSWNTSVSTRWYTLRMQHNVQTGTVTATVYDGEDTTSGAVVATTSISESFTGKYKLGIGGASPQTTDQNYAAYFYKFRSNNVGPFLSLDNYARHNNFNGSATASGGQIYKVMAGDVFNIDTTSTVFAAVPATSISERNSLYIPNHSFNDNTPISFIPGVDASLPEPLLENVTYYTERLDGNRFRVRRSNNGDIVDLTSHGEGNVTVTGTVINQDRNSIFSAGHSLADGTQLTYNTGGQTPVAGLANASTYYVYSSTSDRFKVTEQPLNDNVTYSVQFNTNLQQLEILQNLDKTFTITVQDNGNGNAFYVDGVRQDSLTLYINYTYSFDQEDSTNTGHPLRLSTTTDGTHGGGTEYTAGVTKNGTPGSLNAFTNIDVTVSTPSTLYYYCANHAGMGGALTIQVAPAPILYRGVTYTFDQSDSTNSGHQLAFRQSDPVVRSIERSDNGGFQIGASVTKDMTYGSRVLPAAGAPGGAQITVSGSYWSDWANDVFDNWGYFYLYTPQNNTYTQFELEVINQADGLMATQTIVNNNRTFNITHGYPVQGIYRFSVEVEDDNTFIFGMFGDGPDGNNDNDETVDITVGGSPYTLYKFRDTYSGAANMYVYFVPYQSVAGRPYTRYETGNSQHLYSQPIKRGITVYVVKQYDVWQWVQYDLTSNALETAFTQGVQTTGTPGAADAEITIEVTDSTPDSLYYHCTSHSGQGGEMTIENAEVDFVGTGVGIQYFNVNIIGASDGTYFVSSVPNNTTMVLDAPYNIPSREFVFSLANASTTTDTIFIPDHRMPPGAPAVYNSNGDSDIGGLVSDSTYYIIRVNQHTIQLANSRDGAINNQSIPLTSLPQNGIDHIIRTNSIGGEVVSSANANVIQDTAIVIGNNARFTNTFKIGDSFKIIHNNTTTTKKVTEVLSNGRIQMDSSYGFTANNVSYLLTTGLYVKADGLSLHRAFDGGVELVASTNADSQVMRQTRKYFRYQSGKGIQVSLAVNFSAPTDLLNLSRINERATATTLRPHRVTPGITVVIEGTDDTRWHGAYVVETTPTSTTFTFTLAVTPPGLQAGGIPTFYVKNWVNSHLRGGLFDDQNGIFFEYDGQQLYACRRSSVRQLTGTVQVEFNSPIVSGTNTTFTTSLAIRDAIVIKGQTYRVVNIANNRTLYIQPVYRGKNQSNVVMTKTETTKVPQSEWSVDRCDGTGPTGYNLNINRIQMAYIDYSWYGAGKVRFGFKTGLGEIRYVHEFVHNNNLTEAYMRSGNLPCRYEIENSGIPSYVPSLLHWGTSVIMDGLFHDDKAYLFTASGQVLSYNNGDTSRVFTATSDTRYARYERINGRWTLVYYWPEYRVYNPSTQQEETAYRIIGTSYTAIDDVRSGTIVRNQAYLQANTQIVTISNQGGSAYVFINKPPATEFTSQSINIGEESTGSDILPVIPLISIRLSPSADNSRPGFLGDREIINRMQMQLKNVGVLTTNDTEIRLMLNSSIDNRTWTRSTSPSLSQLVVHGKGDILEGGTQIFNFRAQGGTKDQTGVRNAAASDFNLTDLVDLGNSILGGDSIFPNGPDLLTIAAAVIDTTGISATNPYVITARVTWSESQA